MMPRVSRVQALMSKGSSPLRVCALVNFAQVFDAHSTFPLPHGQELILLAREPRPAPPEAESLRDFQPFFAHFRALWGEKSPPPERFCLPLRARKITPANA